jgi:hypothetical protein
MIVLSLFGDPERRDEIYIFDGQRPSLQRECVVLRLFFKLVFVAAGIDRLGTVFKQKNSGKTEKMFFFLHKLIFCAMIAQQ